MSNVAKSFGELGRHEDALVLEERVLEFFRQVLPEDHPYIGESRVHLQVSSCSCIFTFISSNLIVTGSAMTGLANTYHGLMKHDEALALFQQVLAFRRRILPEDHPEIGERRP